MATSKLRKNVDIGGARRAANHLFIVDREGVRYIDCKAVEMPFGRQLVDDVLNRTETAMTQAHCFLATGAGAPGAGKGPRGVVNVGLVRLANQHVSRPTFRDPADVVRWLGAVQAQDYLGGLWAIGLRTKVATESTVEEAVARRTIVRTWPMRGTLHFVAADDVRWILPILTPRVVAGAQSRFRQLGLDDATFTKSARLAEKALAGGNVVRRDKLYEIWNAAGIATHEARGLHLLGVLSQQGLLCFGPRDGKQQTFTLLEEWLPSARTLERGEALGELARRYFSEPWSGDRSGFRVVGRPDGHGCAHGAGVGASRSSTATTWTVAISGSRIPACAPGIGCRLSASAMG